MRSLLVLTIAIVVHFDCVIFAADSICLRFREHPVVEGHVVRAGDIIEIVSGRDDQTDGLMKLPLAPAPREGIEQVWTRADVLQHLELRGMHPSNLRWQGTELVHVRRGKPINSTTLVLESQSFTHNHPTIPGREFSPAFIQERGVKQAEMLLRQAIVEHIALKSGDRTEWQIELSVPAQHVQSMQTRNNIVAIGGGNAPWEGVQEFVFEIKDRGALIQIPIKATLKLPPMVVSTTRPMRKDEVITAEALTYSPLPKRSAVGSAEYFTDIDELVGKQLRRSVSTGLAVEATFVGEPLVISRGELIEVESVAGSVVVKTSGRAMESGAIGELIGVELLPSRKRIQATVAGPLKVRIAAISARSDG